MKMEQFKNNQDELFNDNIRSLMKRVFLHTDDGKRVLDYLLNYCMIFRNTYSSDPMEMAYKDGIRSVGLGILHMIEYEKPKTIVENKLVKGISTWNRMQNS